MAKILITTERHLLGLGTYPFRITLGRMILVTMEGITTLRTWTTVNSTFLADTHEHNNHYV